MSELQLITNTKAKTLWQVTAEQYGCLRADKRVAAMYNTSAEVVKRASFYWGR